MKLRRPIAHVTISGFNLVTVALWLGATPALFASLALGVIEHHRTHAAPTLRTP